MLMKLTLAVDYFGNRVHLGFTLVSLVGLFSNLLSVHHVWKSVSARPHFIFLLILDSIVSLLASANIFITSIFFIATNGTEAYGNRKKETKVPVSSIFFSEHFFCAQIPKAQKTLTA